MLQLLRWIHNPTIALLLLLPSLVIISRLQIPFDLTFPLVAPLLHDPEPIHNHMRITKPTGPTRIITRLIISSPRAYLEPIVALVLQAQRAIAMLLLLTEHHCLPTRTLHSRRLICG